MRICWVNPYMEIEPTSAGRIQTLNLVRGLAKRGHEVHLIAHGHPTDLVEGSLHLRFLKSDFLRNYLLRGIRSLRHFWRGSLGLYYYLDALLPYPRIQSEVKRLLGQGDFDLIHVDHLFLGRHVSRIAKELGLPMVLTTHNVESLLAEQTLKELSVNGWLLKVALDRIRKTEHESTSLADNVVSVSQSDCDDIESWGVNREKLSVIPLGINFPAEVPFPKGKKVIFVGSNFDPNRFALEYILREIAPEVPDASFEIVGSVCEHAKGMNVPKNVKLVGRVSQEELYRIYGEAAIALAPLTVGSGLKMKLLDYLAWGRPTIATKVAVQGLAELRDGVDLVIEENIEGFPLRIKQLLRDDEMMARLHRNSREVARKYSFKNVVESYENLLKTMVQRGRETGQRVSR